MRTSRFYRALTAAAVIALVAVVLAARISAAGVNAYVQHDLVSDGFLPADHVDPNLVNAWGLTAQPASPWWVADNGTDVSTIYTADGTPRPLVVSVPNAPTGAVSNTGSSFVVGSGPALFLFATEGREDPRVERGARHDGASRRRPLGRRRHLQGARNRR